MKWTPQNAMTALSVAGRPAGQAQRVAHVVGHVLDLGHLIVMGQDDGVALRRELPDLGGQVPDVVQPLLRFRVGPGRVHAQHGQGGGRHRRTSMETSRERAEWVSAPTEM